jgi:hypothetical protein
MLRLTATFEVSLSSPLFVNRPPWQEGVRTIQELRYAAILDDWHVEIVLLDAHHRMTNNDRTLCIWAVPKIRLLVSHPQMVEPPTSRYLPEGGRDSADRFSYFSMRVDDYTKIALKALSRFLRFFKYRQAHALLREPTDEDLSSPDWTDENGQEVLSNAIFLTMSLGGIELEDEVGVRALAAADDPMLQQALTEPLIEPELYEELLSDARAALFQGGLRRAILELAISCEVGIKQAFFNKATEAALSPYFDEKRQVRSSVGGFANLLGEPAERILGQNFGKTEKRAYAHIHHLFECRNQIAHEGKPTYKNRRGRLCSADQAIAQEWFKAAIHLFAWLRRMQP